jgi:hypothetical protein
MEAGAADGVAKERERVAAHLTLAKASGDFEAAHKAIEAGVGITPEVQAHHTAAVIKRASVDARGAEAPPPVDGTVDPDGGKDYAQETKEGLEAAVDGLEWEVL